MIVRQHDTMALHRRLGKCQGLKRFEVWAHHSRADFGREAPPGGHSCPSPAAGSGTRTSIVGRDAGLSPGAAPRAIAPAARQPDEIDRQLGGDRPAAAVSGSPVGRAVREDRRPGAQDDLLGGAPQHQPAQAGVARPGHGDQAAALPLGLGQDGLGRVRGDDDPGPDLQPLPGDPRRRPPGTPPPAPPRGAPMGAGRRPGGATPRPSAGRNGLASGGRGPGPARTPARPRPIR